MKVTKHGPKEKGGIRLWRLCQEKVRNAESAAEESRESLKRYVSLYLKAHPLSEKTKAALVRRVISGKEICCPTGYLFLRRHVDEIWAHVLNGWAYEALSCTDAHHKREYVDKLRYALKNGVSDGYYL